MQLSNQYKTINTNSEGSYSELSSKFLAFAYPINSEHAINTYRNQLKKIHHKAVHVVFAYRLGINNEIEKSSDDGEPAGSSGLPVLNVLRSNQLTNIAICVVRYYGGKKLGIPGLIRAYKTAAENALENNTVVIKDIFFHYSVSVDEQFFNNLSHALNQMGAYILEIEYGTQCNFKIRIKAGQKENLEILIAKFWQAEWVEFGMVHDEK